MKKAPSGEGADSYEAGVSLEPLESLLLSLI